MIAIDLSDKTIILTGALGGSSHRIRFAVNASDGVGFTRRLQ